MIDSEIEHNFKFAVSEVKKFTKRPADDELLTMYKYYKQATVGKCNIVIPSILDFKGRAKWTAWNSLGKMSKENAMNAYCDYYLKLFIKYQ